MESEDIDLFLGCGVFVVDELNKSLASWILWTSTFFSQYSWRILVCLDVNVESFPSAISRCGVLLTAIRLLAAGYMTSMLRTL